MLTRVESGGWLLVGVAWVVLLLALLSALSSALRIRVRVRRGRPRRRPKILLGRGLSILGFALALSGSPASAQGRHPVPPGRVSADVPTPPWTATGGSPPPRPPVPFEVSDVPAHGEIEEGKEADGVKQPGGKDERVEDTSNAHGEHDRTAAVTEPLTQTEGGSAQVGSAQVGSAQVGSAQVGSPTHPAVHARPEPGPIPPLFPRAGSKVSPPPFDERLARMAAMDKHPAGKGLESRATTPDHVTRPVAPGSRTNPPAAGRPAETYTVRPGDSLWSIAGEVLGTDDLVRIARYWPRIHRSNPHIRDPHLIRPGEVLRLPEETTH